MFKIAAIGMAVGTAVFVAGVAYATWDTWVRNKPQAWTDVDDAAFWASIDTAAE